MRSNGSGPEEPANTASLAPLVAVCVCTRSRPLMARRCMSSLKAMEFDPARLRLRIVVVDNDPAGTARPAFDAVFSAADEAEFRVCVEPGIPFARNMAVAAALAAGADHIAFIDDDEVAPAFWIEALLGVLGDSGSDVVQGGVRKLASGSDLIEVAAALPRTPPAWTAVDSVATCNVLFKSWLVSPPADLRFDEAMRFTGGSDRDFFMRASQRGARVVKATGVDVIEEISSGRETLGYECMRAFASGNNYNLRIGKNQPRLVAAPRIFFRALERTVAGLLKVVGGMVLMLLFQPARGLGQIRKGCAHISFAAGCLSPLLGLRAHPYSAIQGI